MASIAAVSRAKKIGAVIAVAGVAAVVVGCGGEDEPEPSIPLEDATGLVAELDEVRENVEVGSCVVAQEQAEEFLARVDDLPSDVNDEVRDALEDGGNRLVSLATDPSQCESDTETETEPTETEPTEPTETEPTDTEPTETQPTETTETTPTEPTTPTQPPPGGGSGGVGPGGFGP
jgi:hypothetical protein